MAGAHGTAFLAAQDNLTRIAPEQQRAEVSAAFYVCVYLGVSIPVIGIGLVAVAATLFVAVATFAAFTGTCALALAVWHLRHRDKPSRCEKPSRETSDAATSSPSARQENFVRSSR